MCTLDRHTDQAYPKGYPRLAEFMASDNNFMLLRSFRGLHMRALLDLQAELVRLEKDLDSIDLTDWKNEEYQLLQSRYWDRQKARVGTKRHGRPHRPVLLKMIRDTLKEYDELVSRTSEVIIKTRPSERDYRQLWKWFDNNQPLTSLEQDYINHRFDLIALRPERERGNFDAWFADKIMKHRGTVTKFLFDAPAVENPSDPSDPGDPEISYFIAARIEAMSTFVITTIIGLLLAGPVTVMYYLTSRRIIYPAIAALVLFTLLFSTVLSRLAHTSRNELFAASAAYCAIMVAFVSNASSER
ncbi:hypothetical protein K402DRAFT_333102 [Aulographum hederae CBS 113979]|uniref:DUF6594 domain-containing protein n=1 Tax=Aulographum hederae CBS 113979 TaxID=1176131 RepID=A0A6G1GZQ7_9PEZI|nr:hypothetical protein K402DRAFT_333102 [Aulographum hederae CBS 113979]